MNIPDLLIKSYEAALESKDLSTQNGAILITPSGEIVASDCNNLPKGVAELPERYQRPDKYKYTEHAERNVIYKAGRLGKATDGLIMVCPWAACSDCGRAIIQAGIKKLITHKQAHDRSPPFWGEEIKIAFTMLKEAGVEIVMYDGPVNGPEISHCGERWCG